VGLRAAIQRRITFGLLLMLAGAVACATPVYAIASSNEGRDGHDSLYLIDPATGTLVRVGAITDNGRSMGMEGLAFSPTLGLFGVEDGVLYTVDSDTGRAAGVGTLGVSLTAMVYGPNGVLYGTAGNKLYAVNTSNGHASLIGSGISPESEAGSGNHNSPEDLEFDSSGHLYATGGDDDPNSLYLINPATGAGTRIGKPGAIGFGEVGGLAFVGGTMYGFTEDGPEITINLSNGMGTLLRNLGVGFEATAVDPPGETPEPASLLLVGLALPGLFRWRRRWRYRADGGSLAPVQISERTAAAACAVQIRSSAATSCSNCSNAPPKK
jgi:hypothetical protein